MTARVLAVSRDGQHRFSKAPADDIELVAGRGVLGDAHFGASVQHRSRVAADPRQPNLRQVHLIHAELLDELAQKGFDIAPGDLGENITTIGLDILALPRGTTLRIGRQAVLQVTGLRNPCWQIDAFRRGLLSAVVEHASDQSVVRKCGIMAVVEVGGLVRPNDPVVCHLPPPPHRRLQVV
jgi:MOSC domain-containing protein YiiM